VFSPSNRRNTACLSPLISFKRQKRIRRHHHRWRDVGLRIWYKNETSVFAIEVTQVSKTDESVSNAFQSEKHAVFFFDMEGIVDYEHAPEDQTGINITVFRFWNDWDSPFLERSYRNAYLARGLFIMTMYRRTQLNQFRFSLANRGIPLVDQPLYSPDMDPCDLWLSPKHKMAPKGLWHHLKKMQRSTRAVFQILI
jgi:hypothetical protein